MKLLKLLTVPVVLLLSVALAVPAFAHGATISNLKGSCNSDHRVCFDFDVTTSGFDASGRDVLVDLVNTQQNNKVLETLTVHLSADTTHSHACFQTSVLTTTKLTIKIRVPEGSDLNLDDSQTSVDTVGCVAPQSPSPSPSASPPATSPSPSPTASTTAALAQTGGLDFRFPLIGLTLLVAGGALYLVSASRGRSASNK